MMVDFIEHTEENSWPIMHETARICSECNATMLNAVDGFECSRCGHFQLGDELSEFGVDDLVR